MLCLQLSGPVPGTYNTLRPFSANIANIGTVVMFRDPAALTPTSVSINSQTCGLIVSTYKDLLGWALLAELFDKSTCIKCQPTGGSHAHLSGGTAMSLWQSCKLDTRMWDLTTDEKWTQIFRHGGNNGQNVRFEIIFERRELISFDFHTVNICQYMGWLLSAQFCIAWRWLTEEPCCKIESSNSGTALFDVL